ALGALALAPTADPPGPPTPPPGPHPGPPSHQPPQRDWVGELSNQPLGRIKIELLKRGVEIYLTLPAVLLGQHLAPLPRAQLKPLKFTLSHGAAAVWIELEARPRLKIDTRTAPGHRPPARAPPPL